MNKIFEELKGINRLAITGHIKPDGDCIGSCLALYTYLTNEYKEIEIDLYLEPIADCFSYLKGYEKIKNTMDENKVYDLFISLDAGDTSRLGEFKKYFDTASKTINIDHHISNLNFANLNHVVTDASSTCEVVYELIGEEKVDFDIAQAIYTGIVTDTGLFKHTNTSEKTMIIASKLIGKKIPFSKIIDDIFYKKTYIQNQILGRCLLESMLVLDGKCIVSAIRKKDFEFFGANTKDLSGIIDQLRVTKGVEVAVLLYEIDFHEYKVSMRSNDFIDVNKIATYFGGGGHLKASGCTMRGTIHDVINNITMHIENQLIEYLGESDCIAE